MTDLVRTPMADVSSSPVNNRPTAPSSAPVAPPKVVVDSPAASNDSPATPRSLAVDNLLSMAFKMDRDIKEAVEDEKLPGEAGRIAEGRQRRARRKSKELAESFQ